MQDGQTMAHFLCGIGWPHVGALSFLKENMFAPRGDFQFSNKNTLVPRGIFQFPNGNGLVPGGICNSQTETG